MGWIKQSKMYRREREQFCMAEGWTGWPKRSFLSWISMLIMEAHSLMSQIFKHLQANRFGQEECTLDARLDASERKSIVFQRP